MPNFDFIQQAPLSGVGFIYKSTTSAFYYDGTVVTPIKSTAVFIATTGTGTSVLNIDSVTSGTVTIGMVLTGLTATRTITSFGTFDGVSGTVNLNSSTTWTDPTTVTGAYSVANYPSITVKGIVYLDGTYYVMTPEGSIYGSAINDPLTWDALNVIQSQGEPDNGVCIARQLNLIVSFGAYSTEFFYDAGNPTGSPLLPYSSALLEIGCAVADSISQTDNSLFFMGVTKQKGRGLYRFTGTNPEYLSNPYIDRIFNADDLAIVSSFCVRISGHVFYIIYLGTTGITLVYDVGTKEWGSWTVSTPQNTQTITALVWSNKQAFATVTAHGYSDGDLVIIAGCTPTGYNGSYTITYIDANNFSYSLSSNPGVSTILGTSQGYTQNPFAIASYTSGNNLDLVQDSTTGFVYVLDNNTYEDNGNPIDVLIRTFKFDGGTTEEKFTSEIEVVGDKVESTAYLRYTDDDYQTYSKFRPVDLELDRSNISRLGRARRRAYELRHHDNVPLRLEALEPTITKGTN